jgi:4-hydroxy-tetrahydrodipicolinate reductase
MQLAADSEAVNVCAVWVRTATDERFDAAPDALVSPDLDAVARACDVLVDFSLAEATSSVVAAALARGTPLVCGVSGLSDHQVATLEAASTTIPIVYDRNMSEGVTVLRAMLAQVSAVLGAAFEVSIDEVHHAGKRDAPSGTALMLREAIAAARGIEPQRVRVASERRGDVAGDHTVTFASPTEKLTLTHSVTTRDVFAAGALRAAAWVIHRDPGLYSMQDVLFGDA